MEHRLIQGGEQFLPFARSCVAKLKKLGLPYADQSYEVDGASIKVRIQPGHEYIRIEKEEEKSDVYLLFLPIKPTETIVSAAWAYRKELFGDDAEWLFSAVDETPFEPIILAFNTATGKIKKITEDVSIKNTTVISSSNSTSGAGSTVIDGVTYPYTRVNTSYINDIILTKKMIQSFYGGRCVYWVSNRTKKSDWQVQGPRLRDFTPYERSIYIEQEGDLNYVSGPEDIATITTGIIQDDNAYCGGNVILTGNYTDTVTNTYQSYYPSTIVSPAEAIAPSVDTGYPLASVSNFSMEKRVYSMFATWSSATIRVRDYPAGYSYQQIKLPAPDKKYGSVVTHDPLLLPVVGSVTNVTRAYGPIPRESVDFNYRTVTLDTYYVKSVIPKYAFVGTEFCYGLATRPIRKAIYGEPSEANELLVMGAISTKVVTVTNEAAMTVYTPAVYEPEKTRTAFYLTTPRTYVYPPGVLPAHTCATKDSIVSARQDLANDSCFWIYVYPQENISDDPTAEVPPEHAKYEGPKMNILRTKLFTNFTGELTEKLLDATVIGTPMLPPGYVLAGIKRDEAF